MKTYFILGAFLVHSSAWANVLLERRNVQVPGTCERQVEPDRGSVNLGIQVVDKDAGKASNDAAKISNRVQEKIKKLDLKDLELKTAGVSVIEKTEWNKNSQIHLGYEAALTLKITTSEIKRLGEVLALASEEKLKDVGSLRFFLSDAKKLAERMNCLKDAAEDARARAEKLATSLNAKVGQVLQIQELSSQFQNYQADAPMMQANFEGRRAKRATAPNIESGNVSFQVQIQASFELR